VFGLGSDEGVSHTVRPLSESNMPASTGVGRVQSKVLALLLPLLAPAVAARGQLPSYSIAAQQPLVQSTLDSGTLIRLHLRPDTRLAGRLLAPFGPDSALLRYCRYPAPQCTGAGTLSYRETPSLDVLRIEVRRGSHWVRGAAIGAGIGTPLLFGLGYAAGTLRGPDDYGGVIPLALAYVFAAAVPAGIGALFGSMSPRWGPPP